MTSLMTVIDGTPVPLDDCSWWMHRACGCTVAVALPIQGEDEVLATAEQFHKHLRPRKDSRAKDIREGMVIELITMAHYREHIGANWTCDQHKAGGSS